MNDKIARDWYEKEALEQTWSVRTLQRNISSQYYYRMLKTQKKQLVENEMKELTATYQNDKLEFIKNPVVAEFLGFSGNTDFTESDLEKSILSNLQKFLMELGKGYAFVARQQHIHTEKQDYYIDLVFYNYILKCFVLIDLKTEKITHQDVGQMDMYIRMYDELKRSEGVPKRREQQVVNRKESRTTEMIETEKQTNKNVLQNATQYTTIKTRKVVLIWQQEMQM